MAISHPIPVDVLRQLIWLDPETGKLYWLPRLPEFIECSIYNATRVCAAWNAKWAGTEALATPDKDGYLSGRIFNHRYKAHRVVFALHTGTWPLNEIDHVNGDTSYNRPENLREATRSQNTANRRSRQFQSRTSGMKGVYWASHANMWRVECRQRDGERWHVGYFRNETDAARAYDRAAREMHGEFARLNFQG
jgi:hypothetical protein